MHMLVIWNVYITLVETILNQYAVQGNRPVDTVLANEW